MAELRSGRVALRVSNAEKRRRQQQLLRQQERALRQYFRVTRDV